MRHWYNRTFFYGDFIHLDKAQSKGVAQYKAAIPKNVFFDDSKVCYFSYRIPNLNEILTEINKDAKSELECIANTYAWVQRNIRYLAYEAGISAHQPALHAETIRKRYGDCKAMSLLLKTLLRAQGFDARQTDIGTDDVPYSPQQVPTIAAIDHAICTVYHQGKAYFLDATNPYIPMGYVYRSMNGAPDFTQTADKNKNVVLDLTVNQPVDAEPSVWYNSS